MLEEDLLYVLALQRAKGVGDINAKKLISHCGSAKNVLKEKHFRLEKIYGFGKSTIQSLLDVENLKAAEKELKYLQQNNIETLYFEAENYPEKLKHCIDAPILLFKEGNFDLKKGPIISVVGTRNITTYGRDFCEKFISDLKEYHPTIVSGFAYGVDICAHKAAVKNGLQTIGVLAHGFEEIYPKSHKKYVAEIHKNGGFLTDFWHDEIIIRENFLKRNRVVAGISEATIIIESADKGGSLVTADIANSYNRDVFAVPGRTTDNYSKGCNDLIKRNKAAVLTSAIDLIEMLNWDVKQKVAKPIQKQLFVEFNETEQQVYDFLFQNGKELLDIIAMSCDIPIHKTTTILFNLEMKGVVKPLPGKLFEAI
ncbi:DNA-protecting protein DprA [Lutibacter sp. HS1-25]|uniref:DNA-processing protein DprA n=1 Tax=Lutibacter sp. HS1-25 TaxID=2485000 RepID=UPI0010135540|nr:DNA-processing protein DprA [Lutibacter sp. HS1-25]RXP64462.1 DNA-protecting protein DprA [Lutibacter sp. HS1-25]